MHTWTEQNRLLFNRSRFCSVSIDPTTLTFLSFRYCTEIRSLLHDNTSSHKRIVTKSTTKGNSPSIAPKKLLLVLRPISTYRALHRHRHSIRSAFKHMFICAILHGLLDVARKPYARLPRSGSSNPMRLGLLDLESETFPNLRFLRALKTNALVEQKKNIGKYKHLVHVGEPRGKVYQRVEHSHGRDSHRDKGASQEPLCHRKAGAAWGFLPP
jgi:hypothetical protein